MVDTCTYLTFDGTCREAMEFYADLLGGEIVMMQTHADAGVEGMPGSENLVMHARLGLGDKVIMASDAPPGMYTRPQGISVQLGFDSLSAARRAFDGLAEGGEVRMAFEPTFWAAGFGMLTDRFGIPWMVNCDLEGTQG